MHLPLPRLLDALLAGVERPLATFGLVGHFFACFGIGGHLGLVRRINFVIFFPLLLRLLSMTCQYAAPGSLRSMDSETHF
jgi:hypothetical protein